MEDTKSPEAGTPPAVGDPPATSRPSLNIVSLINLDAARAALFNTANAVTKEEALQLDLLGTGQLVPVVLRSPKVGERGAIYKKAGIGKSRSVGKGAEKATETNVDLSRMQVHAVIECTYVKLDSGQLKKLFTLEDEESLLDRPCGGWFDLLAEKAMDLVNVDEEEVRKNFKRTANSSSSSS